MPFQKPRDLLKEYEQARLGQHSATQNQAGNTNKTGAGFLALLRLPLLPVFMLFKTIEYVHLLTFVIFGGLLLYFGVTDILVNSWGETALLIIIGASLLAAPIAYVFDKQHG